MPAATVYRLFASKLGILGALLDATIGGDDEDTPMARRPQVTSLVAEPDPREQLDGFVALVAAINARLGPLYGILVGAAAADPDAAALLERLTRQHQQGQRVIARSLARRGALRDGLRELDAADVVHALVSPELYRLLVVDRRWKPERTTPASSAYRSASGAMLRSIIPRAVSPSQV